MGCLCMKLFPPPRADGIDMEVVRAISWEDRGRARLFSVWVVLREMERGTLSS